MAAKAAALQDFTLHVRETSIVEYTVKARDEDHARQQFNRGDALKGHVVETVDVDIERIEAVSDDPLVSHVRTTLCEHEAPHHLSQCAGFHAQKARYEARR
jgi:sporulation protein YlmC with PRC-barrel domain